MPWVVLIHQLPPKPPYLRVKVWRRLQALGAVALKNSVYALPNTDACREDFEWLLREIRKDGGDASLCEARLIDGLSDDDVRAAFRGAREEDYRTLAREIREFVHKTLGSRKTLTSEQQALATTAADRFRKRMSELARIDFFDAPGREAVEGLLGALGERMHGGAARSVATPEWQRADVQGRVWVTRKGIHVDRIGSAWLIKRFIDPAATFKFVPAKGYRPASGELRFDMFDAEFTHVGDRCTFEVLVARMGLPDPALAAIGEIIHDLDLRDGKFGREETAGVRSAIDGICTVARDDEQRIAAAAPMLDGLYSHFALRARRRTSGRTRPPRA